MQIIDKAGIFLNNFLCYNTNLLKLWLPKYLLPILQIILEIMLPRKKMEIGVEISKYFYRKTCSNIQKRYKSYIRPNN